MLKGIIYSLVSWQRSSRATGFVCKQIYPWGSARCISNTNFSLHPRTDHKKASEENKTPVDNLYKLSVNIKKICQPKGWVLLKDITYVEEIAIILKEMGASEVTIANILERCPEAILQDAKEINAKRSLWHLVCSEDKELVKMIEKFPDSFFTYKYPENQRANITYFQDVGLSYKIICKLLTSAPQIFCNLVEDNKQVIDVLKENYLSLGGSKENVKTWLMKLIMQDPFIVSKSSLAMQDNIKFIQSLDFSDREVLKLLSKLKGFIFNLNSSNMQNNVLFVKTCFSCTDEKMREMILKCPSLLNFSVPVLEDRLKGLLTEGISVKQIKDSPSVLELTEQIIQYRMKKIRLLGYEIKDTNLEILNGTRKDFEVNFGRLQVKKERPLFNPVAPLHVEE
ncbi:LOW QUALITY PROTEIN: transcription termination factor 2, mitochondrial-like [Bombina bombina]|uniref:LOW QUALITY PROTEIN: transcription termination factor 2, mitochondrial-like n=1 Tax=Bombina bombina TaxID=8345 RepID=UPI00235A57E3|nr:LOW QUALITY PROTEIN: transcription termination factor 2, mitochondrial-like [Bombina bombina]